MAIKSGQRSSGGQGSSGSNLKQAKTKEDDVPGEMPNEKQENNQATLERAKNKGAEGEDAQGSGELLPENEGAKKKAG